MRSPCKWRLRMTRSSNSSRWSASPKSHLTYESKDLASQIASSNRTPHSLRPAPKPTRSQRPQVHHCLKQDSACRSHKETSNAPSARCQSNTVAIQTRQNCRSAKPPQIALGDTLRAREKTTAYTAATASASSRITDAYKDPACSKNFARSAETGRE